MPSNPVQFEIHLNKRYLACLVLFGVIMAVYANKDRFRPAHTPPPTARRTTGKAAYPHIEASFAIGDLTGSPFDYTVNDVRVTLRLPDGSPVTLPAFYDGNITWRVRYTPTAPGDYRVERVERNGQEIRPSRITPFSWKVGADGATDGFVRRDPRHASGFVFDSGKTYYPIGNNLAWGGADIDIPTVLGQMHDAGENWSRIWMDHWDGKNLEWTPGEPQVLGTLNLDVARKWDGIVDAAEKNDVYFQMTLQHHGTYATMVNPNWKDNPWNKANGGFLAAPGEFFTDARAKALTRAKYRYIIARWGYSPNILAWELFNEVENTDPGRTWQYGPIAAWHKEMGAFLRAQDPEQHLITTSSNDQISGLYDTADYIQPHAYVADVAGTASSLDPDRWGRPAFYGEIGSTGDLSKDDGRTLHRILWASLLSRSSGAAQYWTWETIVRNRLFSHYASFTGFVRDSGLVGEFVDMRPVSASLKIGESWSALAKATDHSALLWVYPTDPSAGASVPPATGSVSLLGLAAGEYSVVWWDSWAGKPIRSERHTVRPGGALDMDLPTLTHDVAAYIRPSTQQPATGESDR